MNLARRLVSMLCLMAIVCGCSEFDREYKAAVQKGPPADSIEGAWDGKWESHAGHGGGRLWAVITRTGESTYFARFKAKYWGFMEAENDVNLRVSSTQPVRAAGNQDLGYLKGGVYHYDATLTPTEFDANYSSEHDHGVFMLRRPAK
jgi:hypothetical protein